MENESVFMAKWIKEATLLNRTALCKTAKVDRGNLDKFLLKGEIPEQHIDNIRKVIVNYGYKTTEVKVAGINNATNVAEPEKPITIKGTGNPTEPKENSMAFFNKYGCNTWEEVEAKK